MAQNIRIENAGINGLIKSLLQIQKASKSSTEISTCPENYGEVISCVLQSYARKRVTRHGSIASPMNILSKTAMLLKLTN